MTTTTNPAIAAILRELTLKFGALSRTFKEYGTYVDELHTEKQRLATMEAEGKETRQQTMVIEETKQMIPHVKKNCEKLAAGLISVWQTKKPNLVEELAGMEEADRAKYAKELGGLAFRLDSILRTEEDKNCVHDTDTEAKLREVCEQLQVMAQ